MPGPNACQRIDSLTRISAAWRGFFLCAFASLRDTLWAPLVLAAIVVTAAPVRAHRLVAAYQALPGNKVRVSARYKVIPKSIPAQDARVRVFRPGDKLLAEGRTDDNGQFNFSYATVEPLRVEVYQEGHREEILIGASELETASAQADIALDTPSPARIGPPDGKDPGASTAPEEGARSWIKDILVGIAFLLALAAFLLSLRNARALARLKNGSAQG